MRKNILHIFAISLVLFSMIHAKNEPSFVRGQRGVDTTVKSPKYGFSGWYGCYDRYYCPYHKIEHHWDFRCPHFYGYYRPWEREWKCPPSQYRNKDQKGKTYWKIFNASPYTLFIYPKDADSVKLAPGEKERVYRFKRFRMEIGNNQLGFKTFKTRRHYIKLGVFPTTKQIFIDATNNKNTWKNW